VTSSDFDTHPDLDRAPPKGGGEVARSFGWVWDFASGEVRRGRARWRGGVSNIVGFRLVEVRSEGEQTGLSGAFGLL
jgi:hypothetical protein